MLCLDEGNGDMQKMVELLVKEQMWMQEMQGHKGDMKRLQKCRGNKRIFVKFAKCLPSPKK
jgi:hypothetical protein